MFNGKEKQMTNYQQVQNSANLYFLLFVYLFLAKWKS